MENSKNTIIGYKGFDKDWKCRDFQYEVGKEYKHDGEIKLCDRGYHFCENPHDVLKYYSAGEEHKFAIVEASEVSEEREKDSKRVANTGNCGVANAGNCGVANTGNCGAANTGNYGAANAGYRGVANTGNCGAANTGNYGAANAGYRGAANAGDYGAAIVLNNGRVKGGYGCVLVARNIEWSPKNGRYEVTDWACGIVDNITIKAGVWYELKEGKLVECEKQ